MINWRRYDPQIVSLIEDAICTQELTLSLKLLAGVDAAAEESAIAELRQQLRVAHHFQMCLTKHLPSALPTLRKIQNAAGISIPHYRA